MLKKLGTIVLGITLLLGVTACAETTETHAAGTYVAVDINPSIEFIVDEDDNVESFNLLNEDAEIICVDIDFVGMNIEVAVELFVTLAAEAGYIDPDGEDNAVLITVLGDDTEESNEFTEQLKKRIRNRVMRYMAMNYINGEVLTEDFTQEDLLAQADELGVSPGKLKLSLLAQSVDSELILEDLLVLPVKDLLVIVREHHQDAISEMTEEELALRQEQKTALLNQYKQRLIDHVEGNADLTDEQIEARVTAIKERNNTQTRATWEERVEQWKQRMQEKNNSTGNKSQGN